MKLNKFDKNSRLENGLKFSKDSYEMGESIGFKYVMIYSAFAIGKIYADQTDYESALKYFEIVKFFIVPYLSILAANVELVKIIP